MLISKILNQAFPIDVNYSMIMMCINFCLSFLLIHESMVLFEFTKDSDLTNWAVVDDGVMGGRSAGNFSLNHEGNATFYGSVSLENNGGFSSIRSSFSEKNIDGRSKILIHLKGDGKKYQFRTKSDKYDRHSYVYIFSTTGEWETISIPLAKMEPRFRGRRLDMPNYPSKVLEEIAILVSNKKAEMFKLEIDKITVR
tara:strand:- start:7161 stop:7751 length:591 start_codon:yes stop_codon:yes gene_type:complete